MKLITTIQPRADGSVRLQGLDGIEYPFEREGNDLAGEIEHKPTILHAIGSGNFYPATEADEQEAQALLDEFVDTPDDEDGDEDEGDDTVDLNAPPVEGASANPQADAPPVEAAAKPKAAAKKTTRRA